MVVDEGGPVAVGVEQDEVVGRGVGGQGGGHGTVVVAGDTLLVVARQRQRQQGQSQGGQSGPERPSRPPGGLQAQGPEQVDGGRKGVEVADLGAGSVEEGAWLGEHEHGQRRHQGGDGHLG